MKARVTFHKKPVFNFPRALVAPGIVDGVSERDGWSLAFVPEVQIDELTYEGELRWAASPHDTGLSVGRMFSIGSVCTGTVIS